MSLEALREEVLGMIERADDEQLVRLVDNLASGEEDDVSDEDLAEVEAIRQRHLRGEGETYTLQEFRQKMRELQEKYLRADA